MSIKDFLVSERNPAKVKFVCADCLTTAPAEIKIKVAEELAIENEQCSYCKQEHYSETMYLGDLVDLVLEKLFEDYEKADEVLASTTSHEEIRYTILPYLGISNENLVEDIIDAVKDFEIKVKN